MALEKRKRIILFGVPLDCIPEEEFEEAVIELAKKKGSKRIVFLDLPQFIKERRRLKKGKSILSSADMILTTSLTIQKRATKFYGAKDVRFYPFAFVIKFLSVLENHGLSAYFLGGNSKEIMKVFSNIRASFPNLKVVGRYKGNFSSSESDNVILGIKKASPCFLLLGSRIKKATQWVSQSTAYLGDVITFHSPLCFDIMCGRKKATDENVWIHRSSMRASTLLPWNWFRWVPYFRFLILSLTDRHRED